MSPYLRNRRVNKGWAIWWFSLVTRANGRRMGGIFSRACVSVWFSTRHLKKYKNWRSSDHQTRRRNVLRWVCKPIYSGVKRSRSRGTKISAGSGITLVWKVGGVGDQAKFLTWCAYKVGVRHSTPKKWGSGPIRPTKITPVIAGMGFCTLVSAGFFKVGVNALSFCSISITLAGWQIGHTQRFSFVITRGSNQRSTIT